jgi:hypothetical protein
MYMLLCAFLTVSCAKPGLTVWTADQELTEFFKAAAKSYKKITLTVRAPETDDLASLAPGFFALPGDKAEAFIKEGYAEDLSALDSFGIKERGWQLYYHDDRPCAIFLNAGTGVFCYDPELTERYLYITSADAAQKQFEDLNLFMAAAFLVGERSASECAVLPSVENLRGSFNVMALQKMNLSQPEAEKWYNDIAVLFKDRQWEGVTMEGGAPRRTMGFFLEANAPFAVPQGSPAGKAWRIIRGPNPQSDGGLWLVPGRGVFSGKKRLTARIAGYLEALLKSDDAGGANEAKDGEIAS